MTFEDPMLRYYRERGFCDDDARRMRAVQKASHGVGRRVRELLGERFAELRIEDDGRILVTVHALTPADDEAIERIAAHADVAGWVRTETVDPRAMEIWREVCGALVRLQHADPRPLREFPAPEPDRYRRPPFGIALAAFAAADADRLHHEYGPYVSLTVGGQPYPAPAGHRHTRVIVPDAGGVVTIAADGPIELHSGHDRIVDVLVTNASDETIRIHTNGSVDADVVDPTTHRLVGRYIGAQIQPLVIITIEPGQTRPVPMLIGTASVDPALGYAVPPGRWAVSAQVDLGDGRTTRTNQIAIDVT